MLKSFVCDLNVHRLFKHHYCYSANLFKGSSALQDGPVGRTALASKLERVPVGLGSGHAEGPRGAAMLFLLKALYRACQVLQRLLCGVCWKDLWWVLRKPAVRSCFVRVSELCAVEPSSWCPCEVWLRGMGLVRWGVVKLCRSQVCRPPMPQGLCDWWFQW